MSKIDERIGRLFELVREYQRLVNSYHENYPYPDDLAPSKAELEQKALEFGISAMQREFVDEQTGIRLVFEPELLDPNRVTAYAPENDHSLNSEQVKEALQRLMKEARSQ